LKKRYFKRVPDGEGGSAGRFCGSKPKQAANKVLTSFIKDREEAGLPTIGQFKFTIQECTRGSKHKLYNYIGERVQLAEPVEVKIEKDTPNEKRIIYKFNNKVMKDKKASNDKTPTTPTTSTTPATPTGLATTTPVAQVTPV